MTSTGEIEGIPGGAITSYCPGCEHGLLLKLVARALDELDLLRRAVMVVSVGCSTLAYKFLDVDYVQAPHGRAPALMTAMKLLEPNSIVFSIQGDGDALSIGLQELIYAANRGVPITVFEYNNMVFGMTGGQMSPTTLPGMRTTTSPRGRNALETGRPIDVCELLPRLSGPSYVKRVVIAPRPVYSRGRLMYSGKEAMDSYRAVRNALKVQVNGGFSFVEFLGTCNVNWKMGIHDSKRFVHEVAARALPARTCVDRMGVEA